MKVILMRDVAKLGKRYTVTEVPDGYALNKLIPSGMAQAATAENLKRIKARSDKQSSDEGSALEAFSNSFANLKDKPLVILVDDNEQDHLFKAVKVPDIAAALVAAQYSIPVDSTKLNEPIKALGEYEVPVSLQTVTGIINLSIRRG